MEEFAAVVKHLVFQGPKDFNGHGYFVLVFA